MNIMHKILPVSLLCLSIMGGQTTTSAATQPELWRKAVNVTSGSVWLPGRILEYEQVFDRKGKLEEETESLTQVQRDKDGKLRMTLVKYFENGKDITKKVREEEMSGAITLEELQQTTENPFLPDLQAQIDVTPLGREKIVEGVRCLAFRYVYSANFALLSKPQDFRIEGTAWLAEDTGAPYEVEYQLVHGLPVEDEGFKIVSVKEVTRYAYSEDGRWYALKSVTYSDFELNAFLMKFEGRSHTVANYSQHWKYEE